jgi:folate-binding protein YgfZ
MSAVNLRDAERVAVRSEYAALTQRAGAMILPDYGMLRVEGRDAVAWLHNLTPTDVKAIPVGGAVYSLLLEAKGHVLADFVLLRQSDSFLLYTSRAAHEILGVNLRRAIFREKVILTDVSEQFGIILIQGLQATELLRKFFNLSTSQPLNVSFQLPIANSHLTIVPNPRVPNRFDLLASHDAIPALYDSLIAAEASPVSLAALNVARVEVGIAAFGVDFDETTLAPEAGLDAFIAENKGCYPGQETIARIRNLGHVNRLLVQLQITNDELPQRGDNIFSDNKEIGVVTSAVWSFAHNAPMALGYTRRDFSKSGTRVQIAHGDTRLEATVVA